MFQMKDLLLVLFCCVSIFVFKTNCDLLPIYPDLEPYTISPILGECYVMYDESEIMSPFYCQRPSNLERQSCIELLAGEKHCLGLTTPGNETIEFCKDTKEEVLSRDLFVNRTCFRVYSANHTSETICQEIFENEAVGIRTPANFIILFMAKRCPISTSADERKAFSNFVNNFSFDSEIRSCFKVYTPDQVISPHTCLNKDIQESCIGKLPEYEDCIGIITPNNETVILDCPQGNQRSDSHNCFKIYTPDNVEHTACKEVVEERCVGITTPTNLTVLLECYYCYVIKSDRSPLLKYYDPEDQRYYRRLVKTYIDDEHLGKHSYLDKIEFEVFRKNEILEPPKYYPRRTWVYAYWLLNTNCYGITLENNETVILECTPYQKLSSPGCFKLVSSDIERNDKVCIRVLDEGCVGITTPQNLTVALACYPEHNCLASSHDYKRTQYAKRTAESYQFRPMLNTCYEIYNSGQDMVDGYSCLKKAHPEKYSCIDWIPGRKHCLGLKIAKNETIEFACGDSVEEVLASKFPIRNCFHIYDSNKNVTNVCQQKIENFSIGITTPNNVSILFDSFFCFTNKSISKIEKYKGFVENFRLDPNKKSCYKVFAPHQEISPYTCFRREADDACISVLDDGECMGIFTSNNETIVLHCGNNVGRNNESGCFDIYTADNKVHVACQEKLEESCVGITTPSKLRVLFDCHTCMLEGGPNDLYPARCSISRSYHKHVRNSLENIQKGNYTIPNKYYAYKPDEQINGNDFCFIKPGFYEVRVLRGHNNCLGITMDNLETIVLECPHGKPERPGCFEVYSPTYGVGRKIAGPEQKVQTVCAKMVDQKCVGIVTPGNRTLPFKCITCSSCLAPAGAYYVPSNKLPIRM